MLKNPEEILQIENLTVAAFDTKTKLTPELSEWRVENQIPMAESCTRQVWYGRTCDFKNFPEEGIDLFHGVEAYSFLLRVMSDIDEDHEWHRNAIIAYNEQRQSFLFMHPEHAARLEKFHRFFTSDSTFLRSQHQDKLAPRGYKDLVREVSRQRNGDTALLIGSLNRHGQLAKRTVDAVQALAKSRQNRVSEIFVTHPVAETARGIEKHLSDPQYIGRGSPIKVETIKFRHIPVCFDYCDRVLIDLPMRGFVIEEGFIRDSWNARARNDNTLTHLRGDPTQCDKTSAEWADFAASHPDVFLQDAIRAMKPVLEERNNRVKVMMLRDFAAAATLRGNGMRPNLVKLLETTPNFTPPEGPPPPKNF